MSSQTDELLNMPGPGGTLPILPDRPMPLATPPTSSIDPTIPVFGTPTTQSVRNNFATAKTEITALMAQTQGAPFMPLVGGHFTGPIYLYNDPTDVMMPVTLGYFNAHGGGGSGGGGIPEAPADGRYYTRSQGAWVPGVALGGGANAQMTGELLLAANPTSALGATPKQYVDAISATANAAVKRAGDTMTGLLILSGDPTAALGATSKQYVDAAAALRAPINNPTFTGIVTANGGRIIVTSNNAPSLTLNNTTFNSPVFGLFNNANFLQIGIAIAGTGNLSGAPLAAMDSAGNWAFTGRVNATSGRLIATSSNNPSVALVNTGGGGQIWGLWSASSSNLAMGLADANGTPSASPQAQLGTDGGLTLTGSIRAIGGLVGLGPINTNADVTLVTGAGPFLNITSTYASGQLNQLGFFCNESRFINGHVIVDQYINMGNGVADIAVATGTLNIAAHGGGNLSGIGLFANTVTIANNGNLYCGSGIVTCGYVQGGPNGAGTLCGWGSTDTINFQWSGNHLFYRIDEAVSAQICTALNAGYFNYTSGGGPVLVSLNGNDSVGNLYGIYVDATSDAAVKENITDSTVDALALIRRLRLRSFDYIAEVAGDDPHIDLGLVAQEVAEVIPSMVPDTLFDDGLKRINLKAAVPYLIRAIQQLADERKQ